MANPEATIGKEGSAGEQSTPVKQEHPRKPREEKRGHAKSSSPIPSPQSSGGVGKRGRSRTRGTSNATPSKNREEYDRQGYHSLVSSFGKVFHVEKRWKLIREMGSGAYGFVISAADEISGEPVAIKMVTRVFEKVQLAKRALREITLLRHFSHENITGLIDVDCSPNLDEIYIFMEPMEADLHQIIKSGQTLSNEHVQYFVYQILRGLKYIHSASVVHRDLKPGNLLVNADCELKICDFGLSRGFSSAPESPTIMTEYVATRWYRAPEIMLAYRGYNTAIDVWSVGCILAELLLGKPLFKGKETTFVLPVDQLNKILEVLGTPDEKVVKTIASDKAQAYVRSLPFKRGLPFHKAIPTADSQAIDLLDQLVTFDPSARLTATRALAHTWLSSYHEDEDEPDCPKIFDRWKELEALETLEEYREALRMEIKDCRREVRSASISSAFSSRTRSSSTGMFPSEEQEQLSEVLETQEEEEGDEVADREEKEGDKLMPITRPVFPSAPSSRAISPTADRRVQSPEQFTRKDGIRGPDSSFAAPLPPSEAFPNTSQLQQTDPVVAYKRRASMFVPSRTSSTYSMHRVQYSEDTGATTSATTKAGAPLEESTIAFPTSHPAGRTRTASTIGYGSGSTWGDSGGRRRLLRTLSTVSVYESGEGFAGGLADIAPIGKYIVEKDRSAEEVEGLKSEMPKELGGKGSISNESIAKGVAAGEGSEEQVTKGREKEKKRRFIID